MRKKKKSSKKQIKRVVAYARVSTVEQAEKNLSLPAQLDAIRQYADRKGYEVVEEYVEPGRSGTDENRPVFRSMIHKLMDPSFEVDAVLVFQTSRFMRNAAAARAVKVGLKKVGVRVISVSQETSDDAMGSFVEGIFELIDQYESDVNGSRTMAALRENAKNGWFNGALPPFGFTAVHVMDNGNRRRRLVPAADEVETHNEVFRQYIRCMGAKTTAREMNRRGFTYRGRPFSKDKVLKIIDEAAAIGTYYWGKRDNKNGCVRDRDEWIEIPVEPIIDRTLFAMAQQVRADRDPDFNSGRSGSSPLLLSGLARCGKCGASYQLETSGKILADGTKPYRYYNCRTASRKGKEECEGKRISTSRLESVVIDHIAKHVFSAHRCRLILEDLVEATGVLRKRTQARRTLLTKELAEIERRLLRWQEAFEKGDMPENLGVSRFRQLRERQDELTQELAQTRTPQVPPNIYTEASIGRFQDTLVSIFSSGDQAIIRRYLNFLVSEIVVTDRRVEVIFKLGETAALIAGHKPAENQEPEGLGDPPGLEVLTSDLAWLRRRDSNSRHGG